MAGARTRIGIALAASALALAGCTTTPATEVTRFHLNQPIARGSITVESRNPNAMQSLEYRNYASIVGAELARLGFVEAPGLSKSELVAVADVERGSRGAPPRRSPISVGIGGGSGGHGGGVGGGVSFPIGRGGSSEVVGTLLTVQIKRRSEGTVIWEGRAQTEAYTDQPGADPDAAVRKLATALFADFPGPSGRTIRVK